MNNNLIKVSKFLSLILRHQPQAIGISLDKEGWTDIDTLIANANRLGKVRSMLTRATLDEVVATNDKKRFEISYDGSQIRAVQGHSTNQVERTFEPKIPPNPLYHGTAKHFLKPILDKGEGLKPQSRHHVHLSATIATAKKVGIRHGRLVVLTVDTEAMLKAGFEFYQAENGVWLVDSVPVDFLAILEN